MSNWEYKTLSLKIVDKTEKGKFFSLCYLQDVEEGAEIELSDIGSKGWELVSVMPIDYPGAVFGTKYAVAFFKRPASV